MSLLIKKGRIVDPASGCEKVLDILIEGETIQKIGESIKAPAAKVIEAEGNSRTC